MIDTAENSEEQWTAIERPGYFGRRRDEKIKAYNDKYGPGGWRLSWKFLDKFYDFEKACRDLYEGSYIRYFANNMELVDEITDNYGECIDNAPSNVNSGCDYMKQESYSTHIQDIAVRNVLRHMGRKFEGPADKILVIRSKDSNGYRFGPGNIPFLAPELIIKPYKTPSWANDGSVESFWQSNKYLQVRKMQQVIFG